MEITLQDLLEATEGRLLQRGRIKTFQGVSTDSRTIKKNQVFFAIKGERFDGHDFIVQALERGGAGAVVERPIELPPKVEGSIVVVDSTLKALGRLANWKRKRDDATYIGITGSFGKTTVKYVVSETLSAFFPAFQSPGNFNNLIGLPLSIFMKGNEPVGTFELGISEVGEMDSLASILEPDISIITGIGPSHTEGLGSLEGVKREKLKIIRYTKRMAIVNGNIRVEGTHSIPILEVSKERILDDPVENLTFDFGRVNYRWRGKTIKVNIPQDAGFYSSAFALALMRIMGLDLEVGVKKVSELTPLPGRGKRKRIGGILFIDDTYNSNPASLISSLKDLSLYRGRKVAVIGDMLELGTMEEELHRMVGKAVAELDIDGVFLFGKKTHTMVEVLRGKSKLFWSDDLSDILREMELYIRPGDAVLVKGSRGTRMERILEHFERKETK